MRSDSRWVFKVCLVASLVTVALTLHFWGAAEVRTDPGEVLILTMGGAMWLGLGYAVFSLFGLSYDDDVKEKGNSAALVTLCGAVLAVAMTYAGGSIGEGPSVLENIFSAGLGTAGLFILWLLLELGGRVSMSITEERDLASGIRLCGLLLAAGLILGRAVAGDWHSAVATVDDFIRDGWPAAGLCAVAVAVERFARPSHRCPVPPWRSRGLLPALVYLALGAAWLWRLGAWEGMPR